MAVMTGWMQQGQKMRLPTKIRELLLPARTRLVALSHFARWSALAKVGSVPAMRLTALVPLIGTILIFNQHIEGILSWPDFFRNDVGISAESTIPTSNIYYTYFGLCILGIGSILFAFLCPREIADEPNIDKYVINAPSGSAPLIAKNDFRTVLDIRFSGTRGDPYDASEENFDYPSELSSEFHELMDLLYAEVDFGDDPPDDIPEVMIGSGYINYEPLARMVWNNVRATWAVTLPFYAAAPKFARDIAFLKYRSLDYSRFLARMSVATTYLIGFLLLLKPTVHIFLLLALAFLGI